MFYSIPTHKFHDSTLNQSTTAIFHAFIFKVTAPSSNIPYRNKKYTFTSDYNVQIERNMHVLKCI
jgi:hypothetical protein